MSQKLSKPCPLCLQPGMSPFYSVPSVPVHSVLLLRSRQEALEIPRGNILLGFCNRCGFISNLAFDPELTHYGPAYESTQSYSAMFTRFSQQLARELVERYQLYGKTVLEIGCGNGEFLKVVCELGGNRGIGYDPAYAPGRVVSSAEVTFVKEFYTEEAAHHAVDFLICKMTLEHIPDPRQFVNMVRRTLEPSRGTIVYFQVPDARRILREMAFWDVYYEHCSYFTPESLAYLFAEQQFEVLDARTVYDHQYLVIEARLRNGARYSHGRERVDQLERQVKAFEQRVGAHQNTWKNYFADQRSRKRNVVLWGAGSKAVAFLTTLGVREAVRYCVDINPNKNGTFIAGTGQKIVLPEFLKVYRPDEIVVMNPIYLAEIQETADNLGLAARLRSVDQPPGQLG